MNISLLGNGPSHRVSDPRWSGVVNNLLLTPTCRPDRTADAGFAPRYLYVYEVSCRAKRRGDLRWEVVVFEVLRRTQIPLDRTEEELIAEYIVPYLAQPRSGRVFLGAVYR